MGAATVSSGPDTGVTWTQGETNEELITILDPDTLLPVNLTDGKVWLAAKRALGDADLVAVVLVDSETGGFNISNPTEGEALYSIPVDALADLAAPTWLYYAVQVRLASGKTWEVLRGVAYVRPGILGAT